MTKDEIIEYLQNTVQEKEAALEKVKQDWIKQRDTLLEEKNAYRIYADKQIKGLIYYIICLALSYLSQLQT